MGLMAISMVSSKTCQKVYASKPRKMSGKNHFRNFFGETNLRFWQTCVSPPVVYTKQSASLTVTARDDSGIFEFAWNQLGELIEPSFFDVLQRVQFTTDILSENAKNLSEPRG